MKKFVVIMISALVLFTFLMLNYLLWDKENLQKQRESDKVEQDWLRGQNRILTATVEELEQSNAKLEKEAKEYKDRISTLEGQLQLYRAREKDNLSQISELTKIVNLYKTLMGDNVRNTINSWFTSINKKDYDASFNYLGDSFAYSGRKYDRAAYIEMVSAIDSIIIAEDAGDAADEPFIIIQNGDPGIINAQVVVQAYIIDEKKDSIPGIDDGTSVLEFGLKYDTSSEKWEILSVIPKNNGSP